MSRPRPPLPPGFQLDNEDDDALLPPPPPGFSLDVPKVAAPPKRSPSTPPMLGDDIIVRPIDGDTLKLRSGRDLRLWGADAPELRQQGWDRQGNPIPIGREATGALSDLVRLGQPTLGDTVGTSYGRLVAPVTVNDMDVGLSMLRDGQALSAPKYLSADPQRRFDYVQAERLARQNFRGMHRTFNQRPEQFRANPGYHPTREDVAQFWDTPTPNAGLTADVERGYLDVATTGAAKDIMAYADAHGFKVNPGEVMKFVANRDKGVGVEQQVYYRDAPKPLTDPGDGKVGATMRGVGNGVLPNFLEEAGAIPDTFGLTPGRENVWNSDRRLADIYHNNYEQNEAITGHDRAFHPYVTGAGEIAGSFVVPMARVRSAADLAKWGAGFGLVSGLGQDGAIPERLTSGVIGASTGAATTILGTRALEAAAPVVRKWLGRKGEVSAEGAVGVAEGLADDIPSPPDGFTIDGPQMRAERFDGPVAGGTAEAHSSGFQSEPPQQDVINIDGVPPPPEGFTLDRAIPTQSERIGTGEFAVEASGGKLPQHGAASSSPGVVPPAPAGFKLNRPDIAMDADAGPALTEELRRPDYLFMGRPTRMDQPLTEAQMRAAAENVAPGDVLPIPSNIVGDAEEAAAIQAGRYAEAKAPNERTELTRQTVKAWNGAEVPKLGPIDMVGWLRLRGGLRDQGGELSHMGLDNRARKLDFAGQETRFGPLVNDTGMTLDDAAQRAWEAGYFPDHAERPSISEFLDGLRDTHEGRNRRFLPDDYPEIDRFYGAQADRYALEQQRFEAGEPIYTDKAVPAGPDAPFMPPEAHEDWPSGGPDFAGNIDLRKLQSPQDISRALAFTEKRVGFDAATRGRVTQAETDRLAAELNMTPADLLSRRRGQAFNAEEALAARQILAKSGNELVNAARRISGLDNPGDELLAEFRQKWMRHAAIQEQVAGMTAEAGRALQQFRMLASSHAVPRDVLSAVVGSGGGPDRIKRAADVILEAVEQGPGKFNAVVEKMAKPRFRDKLVEVYINSLLTNPATHVVNMTSNTLTALAQLPEHSAAAMIGKARQVLPRANPDRVLASEIGRRAFGMMQGAVEGAQFFAKTLRTGEPVDLVTQVENQNFKAISGLKGEIVRLPTRFLSAEDELFKGIARRSEIWGLAARQARAEGLRGEVASKRIAELAQNPPDAMLAQAMDYARYVTFQRKLGPAASKLSGMTQDVPALKLFLPFVRTPTNLLKFAVERSPAAPLLREVRDDFRAGGARRDLALAKMALGTGFAMVMYQAALDGKITGTAPTDPAKARLLYADGWQPYSVRVGDQWISYKRMDPFSTTIGTAADLALLPEGMSKRQQQDGATLLIASIMGNLASKTWLSGISDLVGALTEPDQDAQRLVNRLAGSLTVPAGVAQIARTIDPTQRDADTAAQAVQARLPGLSSGLLPRRDVWGREIRNEGGVGPDMLSPAYVKTARNDPVNSELLKAGISVGKVPGKVGGQELTPQQHDRYQAIAGQKSYDAVQELVNSQGWNLLDDEAKKDVVEKAVKRAREEARGVLFGAKNGRSLKDAPRLPPSPPTGFTVDGEAGGKNVFADLQRAIPGVRFTSGFRTSEYQADMRRRGYNPAYNSGHLDGAALDMLPPPGKSMSWLKAQIRERHPDARLLIHDGHLHATFPGYYGAPVLGGAKAAGLRNPNIGMPAPPPGFKLD